MKRLSMNVLYAMPSGNPLFNDVVVAGSISQLQKHEFFSFLRLTCISTCTIICILLELIRVQNIKWPYTKSSRYTYFSMHMFPEFMTNQQLNIQTILYNLHSLRSLCCLKVYERILDKICLKLPNISFCNVITVHCLFLKKSIVELYVQLTRS